MDDWTKRFAIAALIGFFVFVVALPVSCCGFVIYNEHLYGDVESKGPQAILSAMGVSAALALGIGLLIWWRFRPR